MGAYRKYYVKYLRGNYLMLQAFTKLLYITIYFPK